MQKKILGWTMIALVATGLSACGGDASADGNADQAAATQAQAATPAAATDMAATEDESMPQELPEGVTPAMVEEGKTIFAGAGICVSCHGPKGEGMPSLGADLTDSEWLHSDGSYEAIVKTVMEGVSAQESTSGVPMPPKGGTAITDDQVRAVSAYVWTLSH